jgi:toxin FitB
MIVLDTNVLSELMRRVPSASVVRWLDDQTQPIWTTAVTLHEIVFGIEKLKDRAQREMFRRALSKAEADVIASRVLALDAAAWRCAGEISAARQREGRPIGTVDAQIAGIVRANSAILATRDTEDFAGLALQIVNPWA